MNEANVIELEKILCVQKMHASILKRSGNIVFV